MEESKIKNLTFGQLYKKGENLLKERGIECYSSDAWYLFKECFSFQRKDLVIKRDDIAPDDLAESYLKTINLRKNGTPVQYITGNCEFMGISLDVGEGVLIPRDDTEVLVREVVKKLEPMHANSNKSLRVLDLCSGSGAIAISIKHILGCKVDITAVELFDLAIKYLEKNIAKNGAAVDIMKADIFSCYKDFKDEEIDCIVSNPPYISSNELKELDEDVKAEPITALDGGADGLDFYRVICEKWLSKVSYGGFVAVEIGMNQGTSVFNMFKSFGLKNVRVCKDINGLDRVVVGEK